MKRKKQKIIFIGTSLFAIATLEKLIENNYEILTVITAPDKPVGRKQEVIPSPVKEIALKYNLSILQPEKIGKIEKEISQLEPDLMIIASYGQIIPQDILDIPRKGTLNLHPSLLPKYRGPSPIQTSILNGDEKTGTTIMLVDEKMDHGSIIAQEETIIDHDDTYESLENKLSEQSANLLIQILPRYFKNKIRPKIQDENNATYTKILTREDGKIDLEKNIQETERKVRAFYPWPGTWTEINSQRIKILKVKIKDGLLFLELVQPSGKEPMTGEEFFRGHKK